MNELQPDNLSLKIQIKRDPGQYGAVEDPF